MPTQSRLQRKADQGRSQNAHFASSFNQVFGDLARRVSAWMGSPWAFLVAILVILVWAALGPFLDYSDTWQLVINTGTTIVTFLMVFLIQNSQNRDARAIQLKLDELIRAIETAQNDLIDIEGLSDDQLANLEERFHQLRKMSPECREEVLNSSDDPAEAGQK